MPLSDQDKDFIIRVLAAHAALTFPRSDDRVADAEANASIIGRFSVADQCARGDATPVEALRTGIDSPEFKKAVIQTVRDAQFRRSL